MIFPDLNLVSFIIDKDFPKKTSEDDSFPELRLRLNKINYKYKELPIYNARIYGVEYGEAMINNWTSSEHMLKNFFTVDNKFKDALIIPKMVSFANRYLLVPIPEEGFIIKVFINNSAFSNISLYNPTPGLVLQVPIYFKYTKGKSLFTPSCSILRDIGIAGDKTHKEYLKIFRSYRDLKVVKASQVEAGKIYVPLRAYLTPGLTKEELLERSFVFGDILYYNRLQKKIGKDGECLYFDKKRFRPVGSFSNLLKDAYLMSKKDIIYKESNDLVDREESNLFLNLSSSKSFVEIKGAPSFVKYILSKPPKVKIRNTSTLISDNAFVMNNKEETRKVISKATKKYLTPVKKGTYNRVMYFLASECPEIPNYVEVSFKSKRNKTIIK